MHSAKRLRAYDTLTHLPREPLSTSCFWLSWYGWYGFVPTIYSSRQQESRLPLDICTHSSYEGFRLGRSCRRQLFQNSHFQCFQQLQRLPWDCQTLGSTEKTDPSWGIAVGESAMKSQRRCEGLGRERRTRYGRNGDT